MRLAFRNILHDRLRFLLGIGGIAFSPFLMFFYGGPLAGFVHAPSRLIASVDGHRWIMAGGGQGVDCAPPMRSNYWGVVKGVAGVGSVQEVAAGLAFWQRPNGTRKTIMVVGTESGIAPMLPESVAVDASDFHTLGL